MKIAFLANHSYWGGLQNNGGSRTVLLSAAELIRQGHEVKIVTQKDEFTWFRHNIQIVHEIPVGMDYVIAVSISDVETLGKKKTNCHGARLAYWARPFERWQMDYEEMFKTLAIFAARKGVIMCNSQWQTDLLGKSGIPASTVYAGLDLSKWNFDPAAERPIDVMVLAHGAPRKRFENCLMLKSRLDRGMRMVAFGEPKSIPGRLMDQMRNELVFHERPKHEDLKKLYQRSRFFFCPSELEGFHSPPAEAALCGCHVLCLDFPRNGCMDYCEPATATIVKGIAEAAEAVRKGPDADKVAKMNALLRNKIGSREKNMKRMVEVLNGSD
jgi:glycosyltransferase involved in cell wall biosynthesis